MILLAAYGSCVLTASVSRVSVDTLGRYIDRYSADMSVDIVALSTNKEALAVYHTVITHHDHLRTLRKCRSVVYECSVAR